MNASRTTCWRCASQLCSAQVRGQGSSSSSSSSRVLFSSLSQGGDAIAAPVSHPQQQQSATGTAQGGREGRRRQGWGGRAQYGRGPKKSGHYLSRQPPHSRGAPEESAIELFNNVVNRSPEKPPPLLSEQEIVTRLKDLTYRRRLAPREKLNMLRTEIWPSLQGQSYGLPLSITIGLGHFLDQMCRDMVQKGTAEGSLELSEVGARFGNFDLSWRNCLILNLCHGLVWQSSGSRVRSKSQLSDLINLWRHVSQMKRMSTTRANSTLRFTLPSNDEILRDMGPAYQANSAQSVQSPSVLKALTSIFLQFSPQEAQAILPGLVVSVAVILDSQISNPDAQSAAAPLLDRVATVLQQITAEASSFSGLLSSDRIRIPPSKLQDLEAYVTNQWPGVTAMLNQGDAPWREKLVSSPAAGEPGSTMSIDTVLPLLKSAFAKSKRSTPTVFLWNDVKAGAEASQAFAREIANHPEFLDEWILVLCAVKGGSKVQEVLDLMKRVNLRPTMRTYTNMMHGWKICKDTEKIEALWAKLVKSGTKLDAHIWTERISSLIESDPQAGIRALAEMQALWKSAVERNAPQTAVQPSIEVVNAAFKGLITLDRKAAFDVIEWAGREQIKPNVRTYNILLHQSFRSDPPDDVLAILRAMERQGVQPDEATFTILLEEVLGGVAGEPAQVQVAAVQGAFEQMAAAGFRPNAMTYAKMLYAVTDFASGGADEAIAAVLGHMRQHHVAVSPEIVTILLERAIRLDPTNLRAVRHLLDEHGFTHIGHGDQTLWERVMSAHAVAGDRAGALAIFDDLARLDRFVTSLPCLRNLLGALIAGGQLDDGKRVVQTVLLQALKNVEGPGDTRYWQHGFWFMAREYKLFRLEDVPPQVRTWMEQRGSARMLG